MKFLIVLIAIFAASSALPFGTDRDAFAKRIADLIASQRETTIDFAPFTDEGVPYKETTIDFAPLTGEQEPQPYTGEQEPQPYQKETTIDFSPFTGEQEPQPYKVEEDMSKPEHMEDMSMPEHMEDMSKPEHAPIRRKEPRNLVY